MSQLEDTGNLTHKNRTFCPGPYVTPTPPEVFIIGVEVIVFIEIIESCSTVGTETCKNLSFPPS